MHPIGRVFVISFIIVAFIYAFLAAFTTILYRGKNWTDLSMTEMKILDGDASFGERIKVFIMNFYSSVYAPPVYILALIPTIIALIFQKL